MKREPYYNIIVRRNGTYGFLRKVNKYPLKKIPAAELAEKTQREIDLKMGFVEMAELPPEWMPGEDDEDYVY